MKKSLKKRPRFILCAGVIIGIIVVLSGNKAIHHTSTDEYCQSCHVHPHADESWKQSTHVSNASGVRVHCVECHLPPPGSFHYLTQKAKIGLHDLWAYWTKDSAEFNWEQKSRLEYAVGMVYNESCLECHRNLFPKGLSEEGGTAHLYYEANDEKLNLQCISCHLNVGHYDPNYQHSQMSGVPMISTAEAEKFTEPATVERFENYTEQIPGTSVSFEMAAIPGGTFKMGSPDGEKFRNDDEGPVREVTVSPFFIGVAEVSWDEYWSFYSATSAEGRQNPVTVMEYNAGFPDAISGPTPPFGTPDQGWGGGERPAITMSHYSAQIYCQWLSQVTGKKYRLPTEAEWEYAARGGTETPYFFDGSPKDYSEQGWWRRIFKADTAIIGRYVVYALNSDMRTKEPSVVKPNPFGLKNMLGNVMEYCSDWYAPDAYAQTGPTVTDPKGPEEGEEYVVRGGLYADDASDVRAATRSHTRSVDWLKTDPQQPKSIWWYSDITGIGFRVVYEPDDSVAK